MHSNFPARGASFSHRISPLPIWKCTPQTHAFGAQLSKNFMPCATISTPMNHGARLRLDGPQQKKLLTHGNCAAPWRQSLHFASKTWERFAHLPYLRLKLCNCGTFDNRPWCSMPPSLCLWSANLLLFEASLQMPRSHPMPDSSALHPWGTSRVQGTRQLENTDHLKSSSERLSRQNNQACPPAAFLCP